ncbi:MAG: hypothetical protein ACAH83_11230 [Alphaproteobacteria bacterium]
MFATINFNMLMSIALMTGCVVSKAFAAAVVAGAVGVAIACLVLFARNSNGTPVTRVRMFLKTL